MYGFWYEHLKPKHGEKTKLFFMNRYSFIVFIRTEDIYIDFAKDVETRFNTSNCELERSFPKGITKERYLINEG